MYVVIIDVLSSTPQQKQEVLSS